MRQPGSESESREILQVENLSVRFETEAGRLTAVHGVSFQLREGETLALLGESGAGKSVTAKAIMGILPSPPGVIRADRILYDGRDILLAPHEQARKLRGEHIAMVFQDPLSALNPVFTVGWQIEEIFRHRRGMSKPQAQKVAIEMLSQVGIPDPSKRVDAYPHQLSGGMRQRVLIAMALALQPKILIADEPTTALDATVQAQILELLTRLRDEYQMAMIYITHDLRVVANIADSLLVMYAGRAVEIGSMRTLFHGPAHPYTKGLMRSVPQAELKGKRLNPIAGNPPSLLGIPPGCSFHPRCSYAQNGICNIDVPQLRDVDDRLAACHFAEEVLEDDPS